MKKIIALLMATVMVFSFAACGTDKEEDKKTDDAEVVSPVPETDDKAPVDSPVVDKDADKGAADAPAVDTGADKGADKGATDAPATDKGATDAPSTDAPAADKDAAAKP